MKTTVNPEIYPQHKALLRNITIYKLGTVFNEPLFWGPILIKSMQDLAHLPHHQIYYMESFVNIILLMLNIPAGALADVIGRKQLICAGRIFLTASYTMFALMNSPLDAWIANSLWAIGYAFQCGADNSLLKRSLELVGRPDDYKQIVGKSVGFRLLLVAVCSLSVGYLAEYSVRLPLLLCLPTLLFSLTLPFFLVNPDEKTSHVFSVKSEIEKIAKGLQFTFTHKRILWVILFASLLACSTQLWFFSYNNYFEIVGLPVKYYGYIFCVLNLIACACSFGAVAIEKFLGKRLSIAVMVLTISVPLCIMGLFPYVGMSVLVIFPNFVRGILMPFSTDLLLRYTSDDGIRTTVLSAKSSVSQAINIVMLSVFGLGIKELGVPTSLIVLGLVVGVLGVIAYRLYIKLFAGEVVENKKAQIHI